ncbi:MAG: hypothetical protein E7028_04350 [Planctomycetaceae bacterium]|nr:hypothetical protein [Planctomycetaceae bacterium]
MFKWFHSAPPQLSTGIGKIKSDFIQMLEKGKTEFLLACQVSIHGVSSDAVREETTQLDKSINKLERQIRKELIIHSSVRSQIDPECLVFMSIAKDAERLGDYSKNIFDMGELAPILPSGREKEQLVVLQIVISHLFDDCAEAIRSESEEKARQVICECQWAGKQCDAVTKELLNLEVPNRRTASDVLMFRFMKRLTSHLRNICSSVVQPIHKLDFTKKITKTSDISETLLERKASIQSEFDAELQKY